MKTLLQNDRIAGLAAMFVAVGVFSFMDAGLKVLSGAYPPAEVAAIRGLSGVPLIIGWAAFSGGLHQLLPVRWGLQIARGLMGVVMIATFSYSIRFLGLTEAYTIYFLAPIIVTLLSMMLLGDRIHGVQWFAIVLGFCGVLIALNPGGNGYTLFASLAMVVSLLTYSFAAVTVKILSRTETMHSMIFSMLGVMGFVALLIALPTWVPIRAEHYGVIALVGITGAVAQYLITVAFVRASPSVVAPIEYTALIWGSILDVTIWHIFPKAQTWIGAAIIIASGLVILRHEAKNMKPVELER